MSRWRLYRCCCSALSTCGTMKSNPACFQALNPPDVGRAVERDRCAAVMSHILDAHLEVSLAEMHGTGDVPLGEFGILAHVDEHPRVRRGVHLLRGQLVDDRARVIEQ